MQLWLSGVKYAFSDALTCFELGVGGGCIASALSFGEVWWPKSFFFTTCEANLSKVDMLSRVKIAHGLKNVVN